MSVVSGMDRVCGVQNEGFVHTGERIPLRRPPYHVGVLFIIKNPVCDIDSAVQRECGMIVATHWNSF